MAYFPFMVDISGQQCLIVGGGQVALRKVQTLLPFQVHICLVAPKICDALWEMAFNTDKLQLIQRSFCDSDVFGMDFVVAATDDQSKNIHVSRLCQQIGIPVNAVDQREACSFIFPAIVRRGDLLIAVSSGGDSPAAAAYAKRKIQQNVPIYYEKMVQSLGVCRGYIRQNVPSAARRKQIYYDLLDYADRHGGELPQTVVEMAVHAQDMGKERCI
ncbi:MAG: bifunctional precorrin-2 dehydrogenase/sirohydrochlorin ferrochelatase [Oscillospiraceae bacterium]|nr:bifunctional precorrin-2 dehydrogenase/sirohydrochlorin ferrochelatase [Oscillospiraceae bacterium]